jgi:hypothetical protein
MIKQFKRDVTVAAPITYKVSVFNNPGILVALTPGSGGTLKAQYRVTAESTWRDLTSGTVSVYTEELVTKPVDAIKITATVATGVVEISQA